jgi:hypothetical protein
MEYGSRERQQSDDKNKGFTGTEVNQESSRINTAHDKQGKTNLIMHLNEQVATIPPDYQLDVSPRSADGNKMLNAGSAALAASISGVADVAQENWRKDTTNKLALKASAMQGTNIAINSIIQSKKRNPFMAAVLGQTVTSKIAEAQSIQNATTQLFNHTTENMSTLAELPTDQAIESMSQTAEDLVSAIDDPDLKEVALNSLLAQMPKLAQAHHKERYAMVRNKQTQNNREGIINDRIAFENSLKIASLPEERIMIMREFAENLYHPNDPTGMQQNKAAIQEYRTLVHTQAATDLANGNKSMYDAIGAIPEGEPGALTALEKDGFADAVSSYDKNRNMIAQQVIAEAEMGIIQAETMEEAQAAGQIARQNLVNWSFEGTGSEEDVKNYRMRELQLEKMLSRNAAAWAKNQGLVEREGQLKHFYGKDAHEQSALAGDMTPTELKAASNESIPDFITQISGMPEEQAKELSKTVFRDGLHFSDKDGERHMSPVTFAQNLVRDLVDDGRPAPDFVQEFVNTQLRGMAVGNTVDGNYTDEQRQSFRTMEALVEGHAGIKINNEERVHYEFMRQGYNANESPESVENRFAKYKENAVKKNMSVIPQKDRIANVRNTVNNTLKTTVPDRVMSSYQQDYDNILRSVGFDEKTAKSIFVKELRYGSSVIQGIKVSNGRQLDEALGAEAGAEQLGLNNILTQASRMTQSMDFGDETSFMTPLLMTFFGTSRDSDQKVLTDIGRIKLNGIEYIPGDDSVEFAAVGGSVTRIPLDELRRMSEIVVRKKKKMDAIKAMNRQLRAKDSLKGVARQ